MPARATTRARTRAAGARAAPAPTPSSATSASAASPPTPPPAHVLVCGAGIVGASTAFFLARRGVPRVTLVDAVGPAAAASGRAGGFLARDWCGSGAWGALAAAGFDLHAQLAAELGESRVGYRRVSTFAASFPAPAAKKAVSDGGSSPPPPAAVPWLAPAARGVRPLGSPTTTAQVHPRRLVEALLEEAGEGLEVVVDELTGLAEADGAGRPGAVLAGRGALHADAVVLALGPWTGRFLAACGGLAAECPAAAITGRRAHSIVVTPATASKILPGPECVFTHIERGGRGTSPGEPECYPRPDGSVYVCGAGDGAPLPASAADVSPDPAAIATLTADAAAIAPCLARADVAPSACYLPVTPTGLPFIGSVRPGVWAAAGHGCWGILTGAATGRGLAGLVVGGPADADAALVRPFGAGVR
jgi:glycine/D-amino acid oxidase-like deaminating enzyme